MSDRRKVPVGMTEIAPGAAVGATVQDTEGIAHAIISSQFTRRRVSVVAVLKAMTVVDRAWREYMKRTAIK